MWQKYPNGTLFSKGTCKRESSIQGEAFWPRMEPEIFRASVLKLTCIVNNLPLAFGCRCKLEMCAGPEKRALDRGSGSGGGTFFFLCSHHSQCFVCIMQATPWAKVSWVGHAVKVGSTTVRLKLRDSLCRWICFLPPEILIKHTPLSWTTLHAHFSLQYSCSFSLGLTPRWWKLACS